MNVIDGDAGDRVDALGLDRRDILHEARQVVHAAGRREGARHRKEHDLAAGEDRIGRKLLLAVGGHRQEFGLRQLVANLDGHRDVPSWNTNWCVDLLDGDVLFKRDIRRHHGELQLPAAQAARDRPASRRERCSRALLRRPARRPEISEVRTFDEDIEVRRIAARLPWQDIATARRSAKRRRRHSETANWHPLFAALSLQRRQSAQPLQDRHGPNFADSSALPGMQISWHTPMNSESSSFTGAPGIDRARSAREIPRDPCIRPSRRHYR